MRHLDKQPEVTGWDENKGRGSRSSRTESSTAAARPTTSTRSSVRSAPSRRSRRRAGYPRVTVLIETSEESGAPDASRRTSSTCPRASEPDLVVCLDSGAGDYERMWLCTSLRGNVTGDLRISTVTEGIHSGDASGIVPSSFRVARILLDRIEDAATGEIVLDALRAAVPGDRMSQARAAAGVLGEGVHDKYPFQEGARPMGEDGVGRILARTWAATLSVTGADGMPPLADAGNVLRPETALKLSFRLAPTTDPDAACRAVKEALESDPPYGASVRFENADAATGWNAPPSRPGSTRRSRSRAGPSSGRTRSPSARAARSRSWPLGESFPEAQFVITGVLGPGSNAHGPNSSCTSTWRRSSPPAWR